MDSVLQLFPNFLLIFCRITSFFVTAPVFSARNVPTQFKIGLSFFITFLTFGLVRGNPIPMDGLYILDVFKEVLVGVLLGFIAYMYFTIVQIAGSFVDLQIGFSIANVIDPMTGAQSPILGNLKFMVATLLFLAFNGHHALIAAIIDSYQWIPLAGNVFPGVANGAISEFLLKSFGSAFAIAFQLAAPLVTALFLVDVGLGILARTAPQLNVFFLGIPVKFVVGFVILMLLITSYGSLFSDIFAGMFEKLHELTDLLAGKG